MKIALIGDVHANLAALEAVLADLTNRGADIIINTGDYTGYGPCPEETVKLLMEKEAVSVIGNYDRKVLKVEQKLEEWKKRKRPEKWKAFQWAFEQLGPETRKYLSFLPARKTFVTGNKTILVTHGSPVSISEHLGKDTSDERLTELAHLVNADVIITGHSHEAFSKQVGTTWFINPGSVGRPGDGDPRASYAILQIGTGSFRIDHYRVEYDIEKTVAEIEKKGLPSSFSEMFLQGRNLDEVDPCVTDPHENGNLSIPEDDPAVQRARAYLEENAPIHASHCRQVAKLALSLFDQLLPLHCINKEGRLALVLAANLHDIGWVRGQKGHHKTALEMVLKAEEVIPDDRLRLMVASIARYHRKADPDIKHSHYRELAEKDRNVVKSLASIIRIADGLDWEHLENVKDIFCEVDDDTVNLHCLVLHPSEEERQRALQKGGLFEKVFERRLSVWWDQI
jgi:putative phosphoesterase